MILQRNSLNSIRKIEIENRIEMFKNKREKKKIVRLDSIRLSKLYQR